MNWMKEILKNGGIEVSDEKIFDTISEEIGKRYADKSEFEKKETEIADLKGKLSELGKKKVKDTKKVDTKDGKKVDDEEAKTYSDDDIEKIKNEYEDKINKIKLSSALDLEISKSGAKNAKALKALLDMDKIELENGELKGFAEQLEEVKKENDYLFETGLDTGLKHSGKSENLSGVEQAFYGINPDLKEN